MNEYKIYQVRTEFIREFGFRALQEIRRAFPDLLGLPREAWTQVYALRREGKTSCDWIYALFQRGHGDCPEDFTGHSMAVSDIIETPDGTLWFCDRSGWARVRWSPEKEAET